MNTSSTSPGVLLADAAGFAFNAYRLLIAACLELDQAEQRLTDRGVVTDAILEPVDARALMEHLAAFSVNLLHLADAYGHAQVKHRMRSGR